MNVLELFSGTGSIGNSFRKRNNKVISLDIDGKFDAEIVCDILNFDYTKLPWTPDIIWSSPPCTEYSRAKTTGQRNLELADRLVTKFIEIRDYFLKINPNMLWFCENGASTLLWNRDVALTLQPRVTVSYCQYGMDYQKNTTIATNAEWNPRPKCNKKTCKKVINGSHKMSAQRGPCKIKGVRREYDKCTLDMLHSIPFEIMGHIYIFFLINF